MKVVFMGTPDFALPTLNALIEKTKVVAVYTQPDKPVGRGLKMQASPVKELAKTYGIPVFTPEKVSVPDEIEKLKNFDADFFVIVAYGQILKLPVIETPRYGCINIHSSLLPRWRGAAPIQWSILAGDTVTGITTMKIVPKLDAGDILLQAKTTISPEDTAETLHDRLATLGAELILPTLEGIVNGSITPQKQDESKVTYAAKLTKEMENLDWTQSAAEVDLRVRALNPWPGTKVTLKNGLKLKIKSGRPKDGLIPTSQGFLFEKMGELYLGCGSGSYQILDLQEEGKRPVRFEDFLNGLKGRGGESSDGTHQAAMNESTTKILNEFSGQAILAPSILSADFSNLIKDIKEVEGLGIKWLHIDVMDGHFVPNMTIGSVVVESLRKNTSSVLDCHLMVNEPEKFIPWFAKAGADYITVHVEAVSNAANVLKIIREQGCGVGLSLKPATPLTAILPYLESVDLVLVMSVNPGFGGQSFMVEVLHKVQRLAEIKKEKGLKFLIEIDGGINAETAKQSRAAGVEVFVAGNSVFGQKDRATAIQKLNEAIR